MFFPVAGKSLSGHRILLIVIPVSSPNENHFFVGTARCNGEAISIKNDSVETPLIAAPNEALRGFDPAVIPRLVVPEHLAQVATLLDRVEACVAVFAESAPQGGVAITEAFYGLGQGASGEPLLFQGDADVHEAAEQADDEADEPWGKPVWDPDNR
jgi:hypothetical protein